MFLRSRMALSREMECKNRYKKDRLIPGLSFCDRKWEKRYLMLPFHV